MKALVIIEHQAGKVHEQSLSAVSAAAKMAEHIDALVIGHQVDSVVQECQSIEGIDCVIVCDQSELVHPLAEQEVQVIKQLASDDYTHYIASATTYGKNLMPRLAASLDIEPISDICAVIDANTFERAIYAGNALARVQQTGERHVLTVRATAFDKAKFGQSTAERVSITFELAPVRSTYVREQTQHSDRPDLTSADAVISFGRGFASSGDYEQNFKMIEALADKLGAAIGVSRAVVDSGLAPNDWQVGQTGKVVAPDVYIAIGISGAIQHIAGIKDAKTIIAINRDPEAPIFEVADVGLVADCFEVLPKLIEQLG